MWTPIYADRLNYFLCWLSISQQLRQKYMLIIQPFSSSKHSKGHIDAQSRHGDINQIWFQQTLIRFNTNSPSGGFPVTLKLSATSCLPPTSSNRVSASSAKTANLISAKWHEHLPSNSTCSEHTSNSHEPPRTSPYAKPEWKMPGICSRSCLLLLYPPHPIELLRVAFVITWGPME